MTQMSRLTVPGRQKSRNDVTGFSAQSLHKVEIKRLAGLCSHLEIGLLFQTPSGCWQNSLPWGFGTEVLNY